MLEPSGLITVDEHGLVMGNQWKFILIPSFKLFLTVDPSHGEVSRVMRNRGIKIYLMQPDGELCA